MKCITVMQQEILENITNAKVKLFYKASFGNFK